MRQREHVKTTQLTATVTVDIYPAPGQSLASAREEIAAALRHTLSRDGEFWEDYGASIGAIEDGAAEAEMFGYEGPYATDVGIELYTANKGS